MAYRKLLQQVLASKAHYGEPVGPPCPPERLAALAEGTRETLGVELPEAYADFLRLHLRDGGGPAGRGVDRPPLTPEGGRWFTASQARARPPIIGRTSGAAFGMRPGSIRSTAKGERSSVSAVRRLQ